MKHARTDYDRIQDPNGLIPEDEPVFLIRGKDILAPAILERYAQSAELVGSGAVLVEATRMQAQRMKDWQLTHPSKIPDMPADAVRKD